MLGVKRGTVALVPYAAEWPELFSEERRRIHEALSGISAEIEHVGSTAVPGLAAKPIISQGLTVPTVESATSIHRMPNGSS